MALGQVLEELNQTNRCLLFLPHLLIHFLFFNFQNSLEAPDDVPFLFQVVSLRNLMLKQSIIQLNQRMLWVKKHLYRLFVRKLNLGESIVEDLNSMCDLVHDCSQNPPRPLIVIMKSVVTSELWL